MSLSEDLYKEIILEHSRTPSHTGHLEDPTITQEGVNRSCGDELELELLMDGDLVRDVRVNTRGCSISVASGSMLADAIVGLNKKEALALIEDFKRMIVDKEDIELPEKYEDLEALKGVAKYPMRVKCATLSWNTLEQALQGS